MWKRRDEDETNRKQVKSGEKTEEDERDTKYRGMKCRDDDDDDGMNEIKKKRDDER